MSQQKKALFIGGTKGLGLALARLAISAEYAVTVAGRAAEECPLVLESRAQPLTIDLARVNAVALIERRPYDLIVWAAGIYQKGAFINLTADEIQRQCGVHLVGPVLMLPPLLRENLKSSLPCHLVVIGSTSSYISRASETLYDGLKGAKAQLARALGKELPHDIPGSKVTLACPGGMATPNFWDAHHQDTSKFMDPAEVARVMWQEIRGQQDPFLEFRVKRNDDRSPRVERGPELPT